MGVTRAHCGHTSGVERVRLLGGRYRLIEPLGYGGMSVVWRAYDEVLGRPVAVKLLAPKLVADPRSRDRIRAEARSAARLSHPHITAVYDYGESTVEDGNPVPFVVMELVDGQPLDERVEQGPLPWPVAVAICAEVASALAAVHARGLVHRDIKPANVMLTANGAKVVDFGISAIAGDNTDLDGGELLGTPAYLAPERLDGAPTAPATDVYALGVLLYETLTGRLPWDADTTTRMLTAHRDLDPAPLPEIYGLPKAVSELCRRCMAKSPDDRPTADEAARRLSDPALTTDQRAVPAERRPHAPLFGSLLLGTRMLGSGSFGSRTPRWWLVRALAGGAGALAASFLLLTTCASGGATPRTTRLVVAADNARPRPVSEPQVGCLVQYTTTVEQNGTFASDLAVTNTGAAPATGWRLSFHLAGDQVLAQPNAGSLSQDGANVLVHDLARPDLAPGAEARMTLSGRYNGINPMPTGFALNGIICQQVLVAKAAPVLAPPNAPTNTANNTPNNTSNSTAITGWINDFINRWNSGGGNKNSKKHEND
jgi:hypothetical protein